MTKKVEEDYEEIEKPQLNKLKVSFFLLLLLIATITMGCLFAPPFDIVLVSANDGKHVSSGEILVAANIQIGENIFRLNDGKIKNAIEKIPYVKKAKIYRQLPNQIILRVEEREPYAMVKHLESYAITDKYGYILEITPKNTMPQLPIIYGINVDECESGEKIAGTSGLKYEKSVYLLETVEKIQFPYAFHEINYDDVSNVKLYIQERDIDVIYGEIVIANIEEKLGHLSSILTQLGDRKGKIDMSNSDYLKRTVFIEKEVEAQ